MTIESKQILINKGLNKCKQCGKEIDDCDIAWNNGNTEYGTGYYSMIEIICQQCDMELLHHDSWYPDISSINELCNIIDMEIDDI